MRHVEFDDTLITGMPMEKVGVRYIPVLTEMS